MRLQGLLIFRVWKQNVWMGRVESEALDYGIQIGDQITLKRSSFVSGGRLQNLETGVLLETGYLGTLRVRVM